MSGAGYKTRPQTVLITGATGGIGQALARRYASRPCTLALHGRNAERLAQLTTTCEEQGAKVVSAAFDIRDLDRLRVWINRVEEQSPIDLAIVNAGITSNMRETATGEDWATIEQVIDVNLKAALATIDAVLPFMLKRGAGQIALISSLSAYYGLPLTPAYCATKAGLKAYGEALHGWLKPRGVRTSVVLPGFVKSAMSDRFPAPKPFMQSPETAAKIIVDKLSLGRARISFPFPLNLGMWALSVLPPGWSERILRSLGYGA